MKYDAEIGPGALIYVPSFKKIDSAIQKFIRGIYKHTDSMEIALAYFHYFKIRKVG
jgi:hypothetical protein